MANKTKKMVFSALFAALACVMTMVVKIPSPLNGYINLGDSVVLLSGWILGPLYGFGAAAVGSALADALYGYFIYVPATFIIKGIMATTVYGLSRKTHPLIGAIIAEVIMVVGYYIFEGFLYGFAASVVNIPANAVQGVAGIVVGLILAKIFNKSNIQF